MLSSRLILLQILQCEFVPVGAGAGAVAWESLQRSRRAEEITTGGAGLWG
jgi:hypothetical protein